ncbi:unnamed protein product [Amoebophrya sp. A120]|nr:unnamed protein product [Amoebophrya sp. A120]|eukprot:GSA120T00007890001.1
MAARKFNDDERRFGDSSPPKFDFAKQGSLRISNEAAQRLDYKRRLQASIPFIVRWINHLSLPFENVVLRMKSQDERPRLTNYNLFEALQNGLLLIEIHEATSGGGTGVGDDASGGKTLIRGVNKKPVTKPIMLKNLEIALRYIWGQCARASNMCTPLDFYHGEASKVLPCLLEMMEVWVFKKNRMMINRTLQDINTFCGRYNRDFLPRTDEEAAYNNYDDDGTNSNTNAAAQQQNRKYDLDNMLAPDFADGINVAIVLTSLDFVTESELLPKMYGRPQTQQQFLFNYRLVLYFLRKCLPNMPLLLKSPVEWCRPPLPCPETLILQLNLLAQESIDKYRHYAPRIIARGEGIQFRDGVKLYLDDANDRKNESTMLRNLMTDSQPDNKLAFTARSREVQRAEADFHYYSISALFRFLGESCRREELREAMGMTALVRALREQFGLSKEDVLTVMNANCPDDWVNVAEFVACLEHFREHRDREAEWKVDTGLTAGQPFPKDIPMPTRRQLQAIYVEDLRRHYEVGKHFFVAQAANKNDTEQDDDEFEQRDSDEPTTEVLGVQVTFSRLLEGKTFKSCHLYTTVVPCADQFRCLLIVRDLTNMNILLKVDVGNLQIHGSTVRVLNRTALRRKKNAEGQAAIHFASGTKVGGNNQSGVSAKAEPQKRFLLDGEKIPAIPRSDFAAGRVPSMGFASGTDYLDAHPLHTRELYANLGKNQGLDKNKASGEFLEMTMNFTKNLYETLIVEELIIACSNTESAAQALRCSRFLEELRILTYFLPMREKLPALNIY